MSYITLAELKSLVPNHVMLELSNDNPSLQGDIDEALVMSIMNEACEEVDGYLRNRYRLPFANTPTLVKKCAKQLARYALYERRPEGFDLPPAVISGRKLAINDLENIRDGKMSLGEAIATVSQQTTLLEDSEFKARVRPSRDNQNTFNNDLLDQW
ncbi:gp436 family protein [Acinetobacter sp. c3-l95]|uniref:gp436 family protein n=1 Tax=Acinetobacter sp. c3-l95 TaxID=3342804 RepID=UPI0035B8B30B